MHVTSSLKHYIEKEILPRYDLFDAAHRRDHVLSVIAGSMRLAEQRGLNADMTYAIAAWHDVGLANGRERHHLDSASMLLADTRMREWFTPEQMQVMCEAIEDHRASAGHEPRSIYGRVVADADHDNKALTVIERTIQYGWKHYPSLSPEEHRQRCYAHLLEKYAEGGYLRFWLPESEHSPNLSELRGWMHDRALLDAKYDEAIRRLQTREATFPDTEKE